MEENIKNKLIKKENNSRNEKRIKPIIIKSIITLIILFIISLIIFIAYEYSTRNNTYFIGEKNLQIPIFVYHDLVENESEVEFDYMQTTVKKFEEQMTGLMKLGYKPITYKDLVDYKNGKKAISKWSFIVTFDDGYKGVYKHAYKSAKKLNIPITTFEIDDKVGTPGYYTWEEAQEMQESGLVSVYLHGLSHIEYDKKSKEELLEQTNLAQKHLEENTKQNKELKVFTYPYGLHTNEQRELLGKEGYVQNLTDNRINLSNKLDLTGLHRSYPLEDSVFKILLKTHYRVLRYEIIENRK